MTKLFMVSFWVVMVCLVGAQHAAPLHAADPACAGVYEALPLAIDPLTPEAELPCFAGFPAPSGHPGAVPFYDADGQLGWIDSDGAVLNAFGFAGDNGWVAVSALRSGRSLGAKVLILKDNQMRKGRALSIVEVLNG